MNHAYRTVARRLGYVGALGCLLVGSPALAAVNSNGIEVLSTTATGVKNGTYIEAAASMRYQHVNTAERIYTKAMVPVASSTLRRGAVAALGRGLMHPGLQIAVMAAGYVIANSDIFYTPPESLEDNFSDTHDPYLDNPYNYRVTQYSHTTSYTDSPTAAVALFVNWCASNSLYSHCTISSITMNDMTSGSASGLAHKHNGDTLSLIMSIQGTSNSQQNYVNADSVDYMYGGEVVSESDLQNIDPHIPPQLLGELVGSEDTIPEWRDEITVLGDPASYVESDDNMPPEVASQAGRWAQNVASQLDGESIPNPDTDADGKSAEEAAYEDSQKENEPPPPFTDPEVNWQTETIALPDYSSGIGAGSCPSSQNIALPLGAASFTIEYQPACDLASMVRPALIGICGLIALMIVLRARGGA